MRTASLHLRRKLSKITHSDHSNKCKYKRYLTSECIISDATKPCLQWYLLDVSATISSLLSLSPDIFIRRVMYDFQVYNRFLISKTERNKRINQFGLHVYIPWNRIVTCVCMWPVLNKRFGIDTFICQGHTY